LIFFFDKLKIYLILQSLKQAKVAQLVEHDLAKVGVAGSNPVFRSKTRCGGFFLPKLRLPFITSCPGGGIGRHAGLKIL